MIQAAEPHPDDEHHGQTERAARSAPVRVALSGTRKPPTPSTTTMSASRESSAWAFAMVSKVYLDARKLRCDMRCDGRFDMRKDSQFAPVLATVLAFASASNPPSDLVRAPAATGFMPTTDFPVLAISAQKRTGDQGFADPGVVPVTK